MQDGIFVIDGVTHCFDMSPENEADPKLANPINQLNCGLLAAQPPGYDLDPAQLTKDWQVDDPAGIVFKESNTDVAIYHATPIYFYKDGLSGFDKGVEAVKRYPNRFIGGYIAIDPIHPGALDEMERQFEELPSVMGLKLYPISYYAGKVDAWRMDNPEIAFPLYEKARELGIKTVAVHKSLPLGPAPSGMAPFGPGDVEGAASAFPDLTFALVHGGMAFTEETAWLLARFSNIWVNMETLNIMLSNRPRVFAQTLAGLLSVGGEEILDRMYWASGAMNCHPNLSLQAFVDFEFPEDILENNGVFLPIPQITRAHKEKILHGNLARLHGLDVDALKANIADDEFARIKANGLPDPYSTTQFAGAVRTPFGAGSR